MAGSSPAMTHQMRMCPGLKRDEIKMNRHRALGYCLSMIFSENRYTLFRIML
jgi:hypothetical protein